MSVKLERSLITRVRERFRYGLAIQEVIDILLRRYNIMVYPYFIVAESLDEKSVPNYNSVPYFKIRLLGEEDVKLILDINVRKRAPDKLKKEIKKHKCLGVFVDDRLAGTTWSRYDFIPIPNSRQPLVELEDDEAYLFDAFIARDFRGHRLASIVRHQQYCELVKNGKSRFYSISLAFNSSTRRFKARLGAKELELRLLLGIAGWRSIDFRLKNYISYKALPRFRAIDLKTNPQIHDK